MNHYEMKTLVSRCTFPDYKFDVFVDGRGANAVRDLLIDCRAALAEQVIQEMKKQKEETDYFRHVLRVWKRNRNV
jgi:hypothetical protein